MANFSYKLPPNATPQDKDRFRKLRQTQSETDTNESPSNTNSSAIALNTTHRSSGGKDHSDVVLNNAHRVNESNPHSVIASQIPIESLNVTPAKSVQRWFDHTQATGYYGGGEFTDVGSGNLTVASGDGIIKATDVIDAVNMFFIWAETTITDLAEGINYIYVAYDATTPTVEHASSKPSDSRTNIVLGKVFKESTVLHLFKAGMYIPELGKNVLSRFVQEFGEISRTSGGVISEVGTLNLKSTGAVVWGGLTKVLTSGIDTSDVGVTFEYYYYNFTTSSWVKSDESAIDSANYNDITEGTVPIPVANARYGVHWVYVDADGHIMVVYGQDSYKLDKAESAQPPASLPDHITEFAWLAAKIVVAKDAVVFTDIQSAYDIKFTSQTAGTHNDLGGLQGGAADDYQHLTTAEVAEIATNTLKNTNEVNFTLSAILGTL